MDTITLRLSMRGVCVPARALPDRHGFITRANFESNLLDPHLDELVVQPLPSQRCLQIRGHEHFRSHATVRHSSLLHQPLACLALRATQAQACVDKRDVVLLAVALLERAHDLEVLAPRDEDTCEHLAGLQIYFAAQNTRRWMQELVRRRASVCGDGATVWHKSMLASSCGDACRDASHCAVQAEHAFLPRSERTDSL